MRELVAYTATSEWQESHWHLVLSLGTGNGVLIVDGLLRPVAMQK